MMTSRVTLASAAGLPCGACQHPRTCRSTASRWASESTRSFLSAGLAGGGASCAWDAAAPKATMTNRPAMIPRRIGIRGSWPGKLAAGLTRAGGEHAALHFAHDGVEPVEDRLADEEMPDIELDDLAQGGDRGDVGVGEAVPGMAFEAERGGTRGGLAQPV